MKRRSLTPEEQALWDHVTRGDVPILRRGSAEVDAQAGGRIPKPPAVRPADPVVYPSHFPSAVNPSLAQGNYDGIDRNTATRFRKGRFPLDATLDLHGMTREKAYKMLVGFLKRHYERGDRCVLVITGKGQRKPEAGDVTADYRHQGVLRELLPRWLDEPGLTPMILAFDTARQQHGGTGAFYILLRRRRG